MRVSNSSFFKHFSVVNVAFHPTLQTKIHRTQTPDTNSSISVLRGAESLLRS